MQVALLIHEPDSEFARREGPEAPAYWAGWQAYTEALQQSGLMTGGAGLLPPAAATTVRRRGSELQIKDGPFADTKEQLGGFYLLNVESPEQAVEWAARCPTLPGGSVEIRPLMPPPAASESE